MQNISKQLLFLVTGILLFVNSSEGAIQYFSAERSGTQITNGATFDLRDDYYADIVAGGWSSDYVHGDVKNRIKLHYTGQKHKSHSTHATDLDWTVTVNFDYTYYEASAPTTPITVTNQTLEIKYDPVAATYKDVDYLEFFDGHRIYIDINTVTLDNLSSGVPSDVYLELEMEVERYFVFDFTDTPNITHDGGYSAGDHQVTLYWNYVYGAEEYDLEWCYVTDYTIDAVSYGDLADSRFTRVTLSGHSYTLNLAHDNGKIYYRVRAVGRHTTDFDSRLEGDWSDPGNFDVDNLMLAASDDVKNWTYQAYYAEEGKRKEVLSVFDGSGRNRQAVTLNNTDNKALVAETFYDFEGRAIISTLPAPDDNASLNHQLRFYEGFSLTNETSPLLFRKRYYDRDDNSSACEPENDVKMKNTSGASYYYSTANTEMQETGAGDYIADAELFPFTRSIMGRDGRVKYQSGVGKAHAIGNTHEQRYFYASPQQEKLDRLFGNHAGFASHYQVTLVEDANGQVSMSYTNLAGQVVATSLVGENPASMTALSSNTGSTTFTSSFDNNNVFVESENAWVIGKNILIESAGEHDFEYTLEGEQFDGMCGSDNGDCVYDVTITIWNECLEVMTDEEGVVLGETGTNPDPVMAVTYTFDYTDLLSSPTMTFMVDFPSLGTYYLEKRVTLNQTAFDAVADAFLTHLMDEEENECFEYDQLATNYDGCMNCSTYCATYPELCSEGECDSILNTEALAEMSCDALYNILVADMSPGGQYFDNLPGADLTVDDGWLDTYIYDEGTQGSDINSTYGVGSTWAAVRNNWSSSFLTISFSGSPITSANNLLEAHPEYCHYETCVTLRDEGITEFTFDLMSVEDETTASSNGWLGGSPEGTDLITGSPALDPLSTFATYPTYGVSFENYMDDYLEDGLDGDNTESLWDEAVAAVDVTCTSGCDDQYWQTFRGMYLSLRQTYINTFIGGGCDYLCNDDIFPDDIADNCSTAVTNTPAEAVGFQIRVPRIDYEDYDTEGEQDDFAEAIGEQTMDCYGYVTLDMSAVRTALCPHASGYIKINTTAVTDAGSTINVCGASDEYVAAQLVADAVNDYNSTPEVTATVSGDVVTLTFNAPTSFASLPVYYVAGGVADENIGTAYRTCVSTDNLPNCFCTELNMNYEIFDELYATEAEIFDAMAAQYNAIYPAISPDVTDEDVESWFDYCETINYPCTLAVNTCVPEELLAESCEPTEPECSPDDETENLSDFYSNAAYLELVAEKLEEFKAAYIEKCLHGANYSEHFTMEGEDHEYHYTLYFYDQAGNLTTTVPPAGVNLITGTQLTAVNEHRVNPTDYTKPFVHPAHTMQSGYRYNSYNLVLDQYMPDAENTAGTTILNPDDYYDYFTGSELVGKIHMFDNQNGIGVVQAGSTAKLYLTFDGGLTWAQKSTPTDFASTTINDIVFLNATEGYIAGTASSAIFLKYIGDYEHSLAATDTWNTVSVSSPPGTILNDIEFIDGNIGFVTGNTGTVIRIVQATSPTTGVVMSLTGSPTNNIITIAKTGNNPASAKAYIGGNTSFIMELDDLDGTSSISSTAFTNEPSSVTIRDIEITNNGTKMLIGCNQSSSGSIYKSDDATISYSTNFTNVLSTTDCPNEIINSLIVQTSGVGYAVATKTDYTTGSLFVTTDYGQTWVEDSPSPPGGLQGNFYANTTPTGQVIISGNEIVMLLNAGQFSQRFFYDDLGRIKASQDARQATYTTPGYSYSVYDGQGRVTESGEIYDAADPTRSELNNSNWPVSFIGSDPRNQVTYVQYDEGTGIDAEFSNSEQENLRSRVASTWYKEISSGSTLAATHYSYDIHGNVKEMLQENNELQNWSQDFKRIQYDYDLISGNVNEVVYQRDEFDEFYHRYRYDADNRLIRVETSSDGNIWDRDAKYYYYLHGPLARTETGQHMVQGTDYAYTIQGWLKGVNSNSLRTDTKTDIGKDAHDGSTITALYYSSTGWDYNNIHRHVAQDAFGFSLGYFHDAGNSLYDYQAIGSHGEDFVADINDLNTGSAGNNLYNGNIRHMAVELMNTSSAYIDGMAYVYQYDQLNRLSGMNAWNATDDIFDNATHNTDYDEAYTYDANGNILTLERNGFVASGDREMDDFSYNYISGTNKLESVDDNPSYNSYYTTDLDDQDSDNYVYDEMGNLVVDVQEEIESITWNARGKITRITREAGSTKPDLEFVYDASGQRIGKIVKPKDGGGALEPQVEWDYTWYVKDAQGNTMAVYTQTYEDLHADDEYEMHLSLDEQTLYGSSRIGINGPKTEKTASFTATFTTNSYGEDVFTGLTDIVVPGYVCDHLQNGGDFHSLGLKRYELVNHLSNVLAVVSDRKLGQLTTTYEAGTDYVLNTQANEYIYVGSGGLWNIDASPATEDKIFDVYLPEVLSFSDYYPFHMQMPGRFDNSAGYRYGGSNGQERETEVTGNSSHYSAEYWMYDSRLGRRWNVDPLSEKFPSYSPYLVNYNSPLLYADFGGDAPQLTIKSYKVVEENGEKVLKITMSVYIEVKILNASSQLTEAEGKEIVKNLNAADPFYRSVQKGSLSGKDVPYNPINLGDGFTKIDYSMNFDIKYTYAATTKEIKAGDNVVAIVDQIGTTKNEDGILVDAAGVGTLDGLHSLVEYKYAFYNGKTMKDGSYSTDKEYDSNTIVHEIGHNLGLTHGTGIMNGTVASNKDVSNSQMNNIVKTFIWRLSTMSDDEITKARGAKTVKLDYDKETIEDLKTFINTYATKKEVK